MHVNEKALRSLVTIFDHLAKSIRAGSPAADLGDGEVFFADSQGYIRLRGRQLKMYHDVVDLMLRVHPRRAGTQLMSRRAAVSLLQSVLFGAARGAEEGLDEESERLKSALLAEPEEWQVATLVAGIDRVCLPMAFGAVTFSSATDGAGRVAAKLPDVGEHVPMEEERRSAENASRENQREDLRAAFAAGTVAETTVRAMDKAAAVEIAIGVVRRTIEVLNYFAPAFSEGPKPARILLGEETWRAPVPYAVWQDCRRQSWSKDLQKTASVASIRVADEDYEKLGVSRAHHLLSQSDPTDLESRIVNALSWAGRATSHPRREEAFLFHFIALEALLANPRSRSGVTNRLRLRVAHLIGDSASSRRQIAERLDDLYNLRSALVHAGDSVLLDERELTDLESIVESCLHVVLTDEKIIQMRSATVFEEVLDLRVFG